MTDIPVRPQPLRITFCGDVFPGAQRLLRERLKPSDRDEIFTWWSRTDVRFVEPADVLIPMMFPIDGEAMDVVRPRLIHQFGSGLEGVDLDAAGRRGIAVASVPTSGSNADSVAEHAILLLLALLRQLPLASANVRAGVLGAPVGRMLRGLTVCLYGLGQTARALAQRLRPFEVTLIGVSRDPSASKVSEFNLDRCYAYDDCAAGLAATDALMVCLRLCDATRGRVDGRVLQSLKRGAYLVNAARGGLVDYDALYRALNSGQLAGAGLDVFWEEPIPPADKMLALANLIATPHVAGVTDTSYGEIAAFVAANIERLRRGEAVVNRSV
jgi:phosphoglycerate dehydrogenase-like enzyme